MGREYVIDHCTTALNQESKEAAYREYIAECNRFTSYSAAIIANILSNGKLDISYMSKPFRDIVNLSKEPEETRTAEEIINSFLEHFGKEETE